MSSEYFKNFPQISYDGTPSLNILKRVMLSSETRAKAQNFLPYTTKEGERSTTIAFNYYDDLNAVWLVYFANDVVDPYYDCALEDNDFNKFIETKYGTVSNAQLRTAFFRNNWATTDSTISTSYYAALPSKLKKYWKPILSFDNVITGYQRVQEDWIVTTNKIISLNISSNTEFTENELVTQNNASGVVVWSNTSLVTLKHIVGQFVSNVNLVGSVTANVQNVTTIQETIPDDEIIYWDPVSFYQYETEKNEDKKSIQLINTIYASQLETDLKNKLNGN